MVDIPEGEQTRITLASVDMHKCHWPVLADSVRQTHFAQPIRRQITSSMQFLWTVLPTELQEPRIDISICNARKRELLQTWEFGLEKEKAFVPVTDDRGQPGDTRRHEKPF